MLDREKTERLFHHQADRMHQLATMLLDDEEEARDAVSEVFARLMEGKIHLPKENPEGYLLVCLRNRCLDRNRHLSLLSVSILPIRPCFALMKQVPFIRTEMS